jgi:Predicted metal-dependent phosphoesterases (PHP family)
MRRYVADLHVHTVLSPCAAVEMTPRNIVWHALQHGIDIVAITDHNAGDNVLAAMEAAKGTDVTVLPGMEVETKEEVHVIALFAKPRQLLSWEKVVDAHRSGRKNDTAMFGGQFVVDAEDNLVAEKEDMLLTSLSLSLSETCSEVAALGGLVIASHIDRPAFSILSQLGFIPPEAQLAAVEVSRRVSPAEAAKRFPVISKYPIVTASDAHTIDDFLSGPKTTFYLAEPTLAEIRQALHNENSRKVVL